MAHVDGHAILVSRMHGWGRTTSEGRSVGRIRRVDQLL